MLKKDKDRQSWDNDIEHGKYGTHMWTSGLHIYLRKCRARHTLLEMDLNWQLVKLAYNRQIGTLSVIEYDFRLLAARQFKLNKQ